MKVPKDDALKIIVETPTGKAIAQNNSTYLYDQPTSNLAAIAAELPKEIQPYFSKQNIIQAARAPYLSAPRKVSAAAELKHVQKKKLISSQKVRLTSSRKEKLMSGNAVQPQKDGSKREKPEGDDA